jgi:hypothetical protein
LGDFGQVLLCRLNTACFPLAHGCVCNTDKLPKLFLGKAFLLARLPNAFPYQHSGRIVVKPFSRRI